MTKIKQQYWKKWAWPLFSLIGLWSLAACNAAEATPTPTVTVAETASPTTEPTAISTLETTEEPETITAPSAGLRQAVYEEAPCEFDIPEERDVTCGWLIVPEDRTNPDDRTIRLHVAQFDSDSDTPAPDPIVYLEGGPGGDALETVPFTFERFYAPFLANHNFIMFDQRGTGYSEPSLACPEARQLGFDLLEQPDVTGEEATDLLISSLTECHDRLVADGVNLAAYNSAASAADLNDLRLALGFDEWNLLGISYGTRLAQTTMRDYRDGLRSVILDSTYPLEVNLLTDTPDNIARAFAKLFDGCAADSICNEAYPELETTFFNLVAKHNEERIPLTVADVFTGTQYDTLLTGDDLLGILFQTLYSTELIPNLPQLISEIDNGDYMTLSPLLSSFLASGEFFSIGMQFSVQCNEENIFTDEAAVLAAAEAHPELRSLFAHSINLGRHAIEVCSFWGAGAAAALENEPVRSDIPTLILAGEYDPITPPAWGQQVYSHLSKASIYEFPGTGHGVSISSACAVELVESFWMNPEGTLEAGCLTAVTSPKFFTVAGSGEPITLLPYTNSDFGISGVAPEGWEQASPGVFRRGQNSLDETLLIQQAASGMTADDLLGILSGQIGWDEVPSSSSTYETDTLTWTLYESEVQGLLAIIGVAEEDGVGLLVLFVSSANEHEALVNEVFFPVLDALMIE